MSDTNTTATNLVHMGTIARPGDEGKYGMGFYLRDGQAAIRSLAGWVLVIDTGDDKSMMADMVAKQKEARKGIKARKVEGVIPAPVVKVRSGGSDSGEMIDAKEALREVREEFARQTQTQTAENDEG